MDRLPLDFKLGITLMVVVLTVAVLVLALTGNGDGDKSVSPALERRVGAVGDRVDRVARDVSAARQATAELRKSVAALSERVERRPGPSAVLQGDIRRLREEMRLLTTCLFQVQKQIDDIQAFGLERTPLKRRVTGECKKILEPRFAGR